MAEPKISIIIPTYGRSEYLKDLIESVRKTTPENNYEIIVVSSDLSDSEKVKWLKEQKDVKVVLAGTRKAWQVRKDSLAHYMNEGVRNSIGEWIFVVNDDMFCASDWYAEFIKFISTPANVNVGMVVVSTHIGHVSYGQRIPVIGKTKKDGGDWKDLYLSDFAIVRKDVLEEIGLWDEKINWAGYSTDASMAIEFLTDKEIVASEMIKLDHFIVKEERNSETINEFEDFNYVKSKWDKLCREHNCQYSCDFGGVKPYTLRNRMINYLKKKRQIILRYKKYFLRYLKAKLKS